MTRALNVPEGSAFLFRRAGPSAVLLGLIVAITNLLHLSVQGCWSLLYIARILG